MGSGVTSWPMELRRRHGRVLGALWSAAALLGEIAVGWSEEVQFARVRRLVFVCEGNICRSAYAEARAKAVGLEAISFGLRARSGAPADALAQAVARTRGVELSGHFARSVGEVTLAPTDLVVAMAPTQLRRLRASAEIAQAQLSLLGRWSTERRPYLQDPFGLERGYFETCFAIIDSAVDALARGMEMAR